MNSVICCEKFLLAPDIDTTTQDLDVSFAPCNPESSIPVTAKAVRIPTFARESSPARVT